MLRIGTYKVPNVRLPKLLHELRNIYYEFDNDPIESPTTNEKLAHLLHCESSASGQYHEKLASLRAFRLLEGFGSHTKISGLGRSILLSEGYEREQAWKNAAFSIPLWKEVHGQLGLTVSKFNPEVFRTTLINLTGCDESDVKGRKEKFLLRAYDRDTKPLRAIGKAKVIDIKADIEHITYPFSIRGKNEAVLWLDKLQTD